ncbi:MAG: dihydrofolate reductase [Candidatus Pacebacteria bacterium]|nr:dihydrofolate reductase [Candidatus Paceibacterota bacterium]
MISLIAAIGRNNELGKANTLLWDLPRDMKHFRETTSGRTIVMGQKTFESLGRPLPRRRNIVLTKDEAFHPEGVEIVYSIDDLEELLKNTATIDEEIFIIGGGQIYKIMIEKADRLYITHVDMEDKEAEIHFPTIDESIWGKIKNEHFEADDENIYNLDFAIYERK